MAKLVNAQVLKICTERFAGSGPVGATNLEVRMKKKFDQALKVLTSIVIGTCIVVGLVMVAMCIVWALHKAAEIAVLVLLAFLIFMASRIVYTERYKK